MSNIKFPGRNGGIKSDSYKNAPRTHGKVELEIVDNLQISFVNNLPKVWGHEETQAVLPVFAGKQDNLAVKPAHISRRCAWLVRESYKARFESDSNLLLLQASWPDAHGKSVPPRSS